MKTLPWVTLSVAAIERHRQRAFWRGVVRGVLIGWGIAVAVWILAGW